jgi:hypothetical protein
VVDLVHMPTTGSPLQRDADDAVESTKQRLSSKEARPRHKACLAAWKCHATILSSSQDRHSTKMFPSSHLTTHAQRPSLPLVDSSRVVRPYHRHSCALQMAALPNKKRCVKTLAYPTTTWPPYGPASRKLPCVPQRGLLLHSRFVNDEAYWSTEKVTRYRS